MTPENLALGVKRIGDKIVIIGLDENKQQFFDIHYTLEQALQFSTLIIEKINNSNV